MNQHDIVQALRLVIVLIASCCLGGGADGGEKKKAGQGAYSEKQTPKKNAVDSGKSRFKTLNKNGDGVLSKEKLRRAVKARKRIPQKSEKGVPTVYCPMDGYVVDVFHLMNTFNVVVEQPDSPWPGPSDPWEYAEVRIWAKTYAFGQAPSGKNPWDEGATRVNDSCGPGLVCEDILAVRHKEKFSEFDSGAKMDLMVWETIHYFLPNMTELTYDVDEKKLTIYGHTAGVPCPEVVYRSTGGKKRGAKATKSKQSKKNEGKTKKK